MRHLTERALAIGALGLLLPLLLAVGFAVRIDSPGPGLFRQRRVGRGGAPFTCYKFRTMARDTEERPTHLVASHKQTRVGQWLRRTKLDELPQLWNIAAGDMSFVGPRPCLLSQDAVIDARQRRGVLQLPPGITGLAQICGVDMSRPRALARIDALYMQRRSAMLDVAIVAATLVPPLKRPILKRRGRVRPRDADARTIA